MNLRNLLKKEDKRRLLLLEYLYFNKKDATNMDLLQVTKSSLPILREDIQQINQQIPELKIERVQSGYRLRHLPGFGLDSLYSRLIGQTTEMQLLHLLLQENCKVQTEAAERLFISTTSCNRLLKKLAEILAEKEVRIERNPLRLCGNEPFIRYLFTKYFKEHRKNNVTFFPETDLDQRLSQWIVSFLKENRLDEQYLLHEQLVIAASVAILRLQKGHSMVACSADKSFILSEPQLLTEIQQEALGKNIPYFIEEILWPYFTDSYFLSTNHFTTAKKNNPWVAKVYGFAEYYLQELEQHFSLSLPSQKRQQILQLLCDENLIYTKNGDIVTILRNDRHHFIEDYQQNYPNELQQLHQFIDHFRLKYRVRITSDQRYHQLFILLTALPDLLEKLMPPLRILVMSDIAPFHGQFLKEKAHQLLDGNLIFSTIENIFDHHHLIQQQLQQFDLLLTTFELLHTFPKLPVITIKAAPSLEDFQKIQRTINHLIRTREPS
ncbi:helix-turn-helix domain-containing protein [Enterococcus songbeiensis]|uniref:helix-turn-helix domain-containing protein n=1 Tax=Enterococcus songbeiensis TaxID=2559927 RepID=UPI0010F89A58|nr:helix-turn-helix domain-containing protein [Enterococcus songbeiensis]